ncbi:Protein LNK3 [Linum perenne]
MDQCFGYDDLVVPKDQSLSDGFQSSESCWSNWGLDQFPQKYFVSNGNPALEQLRFDGQTCCDQLEMESGSIQEKELSSCLSFGGRLGSDNSFQRTGTTTQEEQDYQRGGMAGIEHMDDQFLSSLIDDLQEMDDNQNSPCFSSESQDCVIPGEEIWTDAGVDSGSVSSNGFTTGSSCTHSYFHSTDRETSRAFPSQSGPCVSEKKTGVQQLKVPSFVSVPSEDDCTNLQVQDEPSCEEAALHELDLVMTQLTTKTRICLRDALYRLAKNSRPLEAAYEELDMDIPSWSEGSGMEPQTNQIDRAIANMMFNKMELDVMDYHMSTPDNSDQDFVPSHHSSHQQCYTTNPISGDAEVPVSGHRRYLGAGSEDSGREVKSRTVEN